MRILYSFPNRLGITGIGMTAWHQVNELTQLGHAVVVCCGSCERPIPGVSGLLETMRVCGLKVPYRVFGRDRVMAYHDRVVARLVRHRAGEFDVFHGWPLGSLETLMAARRLGLPSVLERPNAHTAYAYAVVSREHQALGVPVPARHTHRHDPVRLAREEAEYKLADQLACPSDFVKGTFLERGFPEWQVGRHHYGYDKGRFSASPEGSPRDGRFTALFAGRCEPRKGLHYALRAWHRSGLSQHGRFLIAGQFIPGYLNCLSSLLDHPSIEVLGFVPDVESQMRRSDVFVLPSLEEGSALVTHEARACGCVLLVSDAAGADVRAGIDGFVHHAGDIETLAAQLRKLHDAPNRLAEVRAAGRSVSATCSWREAGESLCRLYERAKVVAANGGAIGPLPQFA